MSAPRTPREYFETDATYWRDIYERAGAQAEVFRDRHAAVLKIIRGLSRRDEARALEVGCGAGFLAVEIARCGYQVEAIDSSKAMVDLARRTAASAGLEARLRIDTGDVYELAARTASCDLVVAVAVLPWVERAQPAISEMARVLRPGGHLVITADNWARLNTFLDPKYNPALASARRRLRGVLAGAGFLNGASYPSARFHHRGAVDAMVEAAGMSVVARRAIGFGPFTFLGRALLPDSLGVRLHRSLQGLADGGVPALQALGGHYVLVARKS